MAIKDVKFRNAKPKEKPYKVSDEKGLYPNFPKKL